MNSPTLQGSPPDTLEPSAHHVRSSFSVSDAFIRNVARVGLIQPPIARDEAGDLRIIDGVRRVVAATKAGFDEIPVLVYDMDDTEALSASLTANTAVFTKSVTESDEERAFRTLVGGPETTVNEWETTEDIFNARYALGLVDETDVMMRVIGDVDGVGMATATALADWFETPDESLTASQSTLEDIPGIGTKTASAIYEYLHEVETADIDFPTDVIDK